MKTIFAAALLATAAIATPAFAPAALAQGQGGYTDGAPGQDTAAAPAYVRDKLRDWHATNDTSGGVSSIDKSGLTQQGGRALHGAQGTQQAMGAHARGNMGGAKTGEIDR